MDPALSPLSVIAGLLTSGLYSLTLLTGYKVEDLAFREEDIYKRLTKNVARFDLIIEEAFQDFPHVIKTEEFYEFLKSDEAAEIVKRIYSFGLSEYKNIDNLEIIEDVFCENLDYLEKVKEDFCEQITLYFRQQKEILTIAPQLFSVLVECCLKSLDVMINEKQDLSALDAKIQFYFKINQTLLKQLIDKTDFIRRNSEAQCERNVIVGKDSINSLIVTGDRNKIFIDKYVTLRDAYIYPGEVFNRVDLDNFVGREWLLDIVDSFLLNKNQGYFILEGEAGFGKTAFLAWLVRERGYIHNFCELTPGLDKIGDGLRNLASQLALAYDLSTEGVLPTDVTSRSDYLYKMLENAAKQRDTGEKIVLVVDALDEAGALKGQNVLGLPKSLPEGVFIVVSQRPVGVTLNLDTATTSHFVCRLSGYKEKNEDDIRHFLYNATNKPKIAAVLQDCGYTSDEFVTTLMEKCQGVWVYLHYVIPEIESNTRSTLDLDLLPEGLLNYYIEYWARWRENDKWYKSYLPLLASLAAAQESISIERLAVWASSPMSMPELRRLLKEQWRPYMIVSLQDRQERYRFYHPTLKELFEGRVERENLNTAEEAFVDELKEATIEAHKSLVERYLTAWGGLKDGLPGLQNSRNLAIDDGYGLRYLTVHLEASGRADELHCLMSLKTAERHNAWYEAKEAYGNVADYMIDVSRAWQLAEDESESKIKKKEIAPTIGMETRYALISASVKSLSANIQPDLLVALVENGIWTLNKGLAYARQIPELGQRVDALISIIINLPESQLPRSQREEILKKALDAAKQIQDGYSRTEALVGLVPHLPESMIKEAIDAAILIHSEHFRASALVRIFPYLSESMMKEVLDATIQIQNEYYRVETLTEIVPYLPKFIMKEALDATMQIRSEHLRAMALSEMAPHLPEPMLKEALEEALGSVMKIQDEHFRAMALVRMAPHLSESMMKDALAAATQIQSGHLRAMALSGLAPNLPESMMKNTLDSVTKIQNDSDRVDTFVRLAPNLPESTIKEDLKEALDSATKIQDEYYRASALARLAPHLPESMIKEDLKEALDSATKIQDEYYRASALARLAPHLPKYMTKEALAAVIQIQYEYLRAEALVKIVPYLHESMIKEALNAAIKIKDGSTRAGALVGLVPYLPEYMIKEALASVIQIQDARSRAEALAGLAPNLPEYMIKEALDLAKQIHSEHFRAIALARLSPHLPKSVAKEALASVIQIQDARSRAEALAGLAPNLPESMIKEALDAATKIHSEHFRAVALVRMAPHLPKSMMKETLDAATKIRSEHLRTMALSGLVPHLPEPMLKEALEEALGSVMKIQDEHFRAMALVRMAPHLSESMMKDALAAATQIQSGHLRAMALTRLAPYLPKSMMKEVLYEVMKIQNESDRVEALAGVVPHLPESMIKEALAAATQIKKDSDRVKALAGLVPYLPESMMKEVLYAVAQIQNERYQAEALVRLAPHLPKSMMKDVLDSVMLIQNERYQVEALVNIVSRDASIFSLDLLHVIWMKILHGSTSSRRKLFTNLGKMKPAIYKLGDEKALNETFYAIQDVARWWP